MCKIPVLQFSEIVVTFVITHFKMTAITIRKYKSDDYKDVCRILISSHRGNIKHGIPIGIKSPYVISYLAFFTLFGSFYSLILGCLALLFGLTFFAMVISYMYISFG